MCRIAGVAHLACPFSVSYRRDTLAAPPVGVYARCRLAMEYPTQTSRLTKAEDKGFDTVLVSPCNNSGLEQSAKSGGVKSGVICENPENEYLADVISALAHPRGHSTPCSAVCPVGVG